MYVLPFSYHILLQIHHIFSTSDVRHSMNAPATEYHQRTVYNTHSVTAYVRVFLKLTYGPITIAIRARFDYDSSTIQHPTRSYVLSSNNEHVNSFAML